MTPWNTHGLTYRVAIIGSGPSGLYAAEALTTQGDVPVHVDVYDHLPTPYGLVRYGVAPDHQHIKAVAATFQRILAHPHVRFLGNVAFGRDLTPDDLARHYDAVVYATGAASDRALGIPGEDLPGSISAGAFVAWYNGHPDRDAGVLPPMVRDVVVIGAGNVALDVTRILARTADELATTDIADDALCALAHSHVRDIYLLARRGPAQARFTPKELKELGALAGADIIVRRDEIACAAGDVATTDGAARRNLEMLAAWAERPLGGKPRCIHLRFLAAPVELIGRDRVEGVRIERNRLEAEGNAVGTGRYEALPAQLVLRAVGYRGLPLAGVPFDAGRGIIPNRNGCVLRDGAVVPGRYVAGWIKREPSGIIGTNRACAVETVGHLLRDLPDLPRAIQPDPAAVTALLERRGVPYVTLDEWLRLDRVEQERGAAQGRPRVKVVSRRAMLHLAHGQVVGGRREVATVIAGGRGTPLASVGA